MHPDRKYKIHVDFEFTSRAQQEPIMMQTKINPVSRSQQSLNLMSESALISQGSQLLDYFKYLVSAYVPFSSLIVTPCCSQHQPSSTQIKVLESFDNRNFDVESLEFLLSSGQHKLKHANLVIE